MPIKLGEISPTMRGHYRRAWAQLENTLDGLILSTPSGPLRNKLTEINMQVIALEGEKNRLLESARSAEDGT